MNALVLLAQARPTDRAKHQLLTRRSMHRLNRKTGLEPRRRQAKVPNVEN